MNAILSIPYGEHTLHAAVCRHTSSVQKGCIFYLHGGGLVFGTSDDLPGIYEKLFLSAGYDLLRLDYPLAPESYLAEILEAVHHSVTYLLTHPKLYGYEKTPPYFLFGRSAGAYLALLASRRLCAKTSALPAPSGMICFYGYHTLDLPEFRRPALAYVKMAAVPKDVVNKLAGTQFVTEGPMALRYSIYIYARQTGTWAEFLGTPEEIAQYSLSSEDFALLPPGFFSASSGDQDVPFRESKQMAAAIPGSKFQPVYYLEHDFDRDTTKKEGIQVYRAAIDWMESLA